MAKKKKNNLLIFGALAAAALLFMNKNKNSGEEFTPKRQLAPKKMAPGKFTAQVNKLGSGRRSQIDGVHSCII